MKMMNYIPGTVLEFNEGLYNNTFAVLSPIFSVTKGLTLGQLKELTALEGSTIQNWVKRGWVANPREKRYGEEQVVRILLINMLRNSMQLDKIVALMKFINGQVEDRSDDIIPDKKLYNVLCSVIYMCDKAHTTDKTEIEGIIDGELSSYDGTAENREKLRKALLCMTLGFISSEIKKLSEQEYESLL